MTHIITIETQNDHEFAQIKELAERLGVFFQETHSERSLADRVSPEEALKKFTGSWQGPETGDELMEMVYIECHDYLRDVEL